MSQSKRIQPDSNQSSMERPTLAKETSFCRLHGKEHEDRNSDVLGSSQLVTSHQYY